MTSQPILAILLGAVLTLFAKPLANLKNRKRQARLAQLDAGAEEQFFEERRSLESYLATAGKLRVLGIVSLALGIGLIVLSR